MQNNWKVVCNDFSPNCNRHPAGSQPSEALSLTRVLRGEAKLTLAKGRRTCFAWLLPRETSGMRIDTSDY
eukprot:3042408-Amphidinium_carterae.1